MEWNIACTCQESSAVLFAKMYDELSFSYISNFKQWPTCVCTTKSLITQYLYVRENRVADQDDRYNYNKGSKHPI